MLLLMTVVMMVRLMMVVMMDLKAVQKELLKTVQVMEIVLQNLGLVTALVIVKISSMVRI